MSRTCALTVALAAPLPAQEFQDRVDSYLEPLVEAGISSAAQVTGRLFWASASR